MPDLCEIPNCGLPMKHSAAWADANGIIWLSLCDRHYRGLLDHRNRIEAHMEERESCATN